MWPLTLKEEHRPRVFKNKVQWRIFVSKWEEITEEWRRLHKEELYDLYSSSYVICLIK